MKVRDYMTHSVVTVEFGAPIREAWVLMDKHNIHHLPVVNGQKLVGIVSDKDLYRALPSILDIKDTQKLERALDTVTVVDVMTKSVKAITPDMDIHHAANLFIEHKFRCFPVVDGGKLSGILTTTDLLRYIADLEPDDKKIIG